MNPNSNNGRAIRRPDALTRAKMQAYLLQIWTKVDVTILFITHDLEEAIYLSDRILVLGGTQVEFASSSKIRSRVQEHGSSFSLQNFWP